MPKRLQGVLAPGASRKADLIRWAFYDLYKRACHRAANRILVLQNSDGSYTVRNPFNQGIYAVYEQLAGYEFELTGFDPYQ